jgi:hypothetical protein
MKRKKIFRIVLTLALIGVVIGGGIGLYMYFMPHRDIQSLPVDFQVTNTNFVNEYLEDWDAANKKYLAADGNSKILEVTGTVVRIQEDFNGQQVVLLKEASDKAGVSCTFMPETNDSALNLSVGQRTTIKGVIRSGVSFDPDLNMYLHAVLEKCNVVYD